MSDRKKKYDYTWESLATHPSAKWFDNAKFGIFIHWGPYSHWSYRKEGVGFAEQTPKVAYLQPQFYYDYLDKNFGGHPPEFGYKDTVAAFKAEKFDPNEWATLFEKAGAKYVVLTAEHHDGYALWDSDITEWCATKIGPKRDLVGDLGVAVREKGMKYAPSYHRERHPGYFTKAIHQIYCEPHEDILEEIKRMPEAADLYGPFEFSDAFIADYVARWKEIQEKYQPDFMWIDNVKIFSRAAEGKDHPQLDKFRDAFKHMIADYFNAAESWGKEVYLNNKGSFKFDGMNWPEKSLGCREEDNLDMEDISVKWQNPATLGTSYGYMLSEEENDEYKTSTELIHLLCDVVSKNGNLLLNIGPRGDGSIPERMQSRLLAIGEWLSTNAEAIYDTTPWVTYSQSETKIRFTFNNDCLYAILLEKQTAPFTIKMDTEKLTGLTVALSILGSEEPIEWKVVEEGIYITPLKDWIGEHAWTIKVDGICK